MTHSVKNITLYFSTDESIYQTLLCDIKYDNLLSTPFIFRNHQDSFTIFIMRKLPKFLIKNFSKIETEFFYKEKVEIIEIIFWDDSLFAKFWPVSAIFYHFGEHFIIMFLKRFWTWFFNVPSKINSGVLWRIKKIWITKHRQFLAPSLWKNKPTGSTRSIS